MFVRLPFCFVYFNGHGWNISWTLRKMYSEEEVTTDDAEV